MRAVGLLARFALMALVLPVSVHAQVIQGRVLHVSSGDPVRDASVVLLEGEQIRRGTLTELDGSFIIEAPKSGTYTIRVGAAGFTTWDSRPIKVGTDAPVEMMVRLSEEGAGNLLAGFDRRREGGQGTFLTKDEIKKGGRDFTDVMRLVAGVSVVPLPIDSSLVASQDAARIGGEYAGRNYTVRIAGGGVQQRAVGAGQTREASTDCVPVLWVDGRWWGPIDKASDVGPDGTLIPRDLERIEVYHKSEVPPEFDSGLDTLCGVIVVWTKSAKEK